MKNNYKNKQGGLIKMIILIIIAIAVLSYFRIDIKEFFTSPMFKTNMGYIGNFLKDLWSNYLAEPAHKLWEVWVDHIWGPFMDMLKREDHAKIPTI